MLKNILILFIIIFSYKLITCISDLTRIIKYKNLYSKYLKYNNENFKQYAKLSVDLLKKLGIKESITNGGLSPVLANITMKNSLISQHITDKFESAVGIAKYNLKQCFSPIYWINSLLFLPKNIFVYLNVSAESILVKIFQFIYWFAGVIFTLFSSDIANWIKSFIQT